MKTNLNYCIVLSSEQLSYLAVSKYGIDRMNILHRIIEAAVLKETKYAIKGFSTTLQVGQAILSEVDLSSKLGYDKKTISRVLDKMNQLGIVATTQSNRTVITAFRRCREYNSAPSCLIVSGTQKQKIILRSRENSSVLKRRSRYWRHSGIGWINSVQIREPVWRKR